MRIGFIQFDCKFGETEVNLRKMKILLSQESTDLWVAPELCHTGYLFQKKEELEKLAEEIPNGPTTQFFIEQAKRYNTTIVAGVAERDGDSFYNSSVCVNGTQGFLGKYRKVHLFDREKLFFEPGNLSFNVIDIGPYKLGMMICFDWIYPEAARSLALLGADIICHPSNLVLPYCQDAMITRCLENRVFAITANRIGTENRGALTLRFTGQSEIVSPKGDLLAKAGVNSEEAQFVTINPADARDKHATPQNPLFKDRNTDLYTL